MNARILIVDDDPAVLTILEASVAYGGFDCRSAVSGEEALATFKAEAFDAVLLDLGLPDVEGGELLQKMRALSDVPIIVVSGRNTEEDKIQALDLGADDYVPKPFLPGELLARIRAALRRAPDEGAGEADEHPIRLGGLVLDPLYRSIRLGGREAPLTGAEYKVMRLLVENRNAPVSRASILEALYGIEDERETKIVEVYLARIRRKLKELTGGIDLIETQRGRGWVLRPPE